MNSNALTSMRYIKLILSIIIILVLGYIIFGQIFFPHNTPTLHGVCEELPSDNWYVVDGDNNRKNFIIPAKVNNDITLETILPYDIGRDKDVLVVRGRDMRIYIDGELRTEYIVDDYKLLADRSAECYVTLPIYQEDAGKVLRVEYYINNSGNIYESYIGNSIGIFGELFDNYGDELFVAFAVMLLGIICYIASIAYQIIYREYLELRHLALGVILGCMWVISNSIFRQFYTRNVSVMSDIPFLMVLVMPLPFIVFINSLQRDRHRKILMAAAIMEIASFAVCITLFVSGIYTLKQTFPVSASCALISIIIIIYTLVYEAVTRNIASYRFIAAGFAIFGVMAIVQIVQYVMARSTVFSGVYMAWGLLAFIICAMIHTVKFVIDSRLAVSEAISKNKIKDEFLANMSHEIRTPLNGILGMDEMIIRRTGEAKTKEYALGIKGAGETLLNLVNDILDISKIESGNVKLIERPYDLASIINDVINMTRDKALKKDLSYNVTVDRDIPATLIGDELRVKQVIINIINNAVKYTEKGFVDVKVDFDKTDEQHINLRVVVADSGIGIRDEDRDKLFTSFMRLDEEKNYTVEGTGLGLNITGRLVEMMDGHIDVDSTYGKGSTFTIYMRQSYEDATPIGEFSEAVKRYMNTVEIEEAKLYIPSVRILAVDDSKMNLNVLEGLLSDSAAKIDTASSGEECIELMSNNSYDIVLLDQMMPQMSGEETLRIIRDKSLDRGTPIIALTADAILGARENYINMGFTDYLSKPIQYARLEKMLSQYIPDDKIIIRDESSDDKKVLLICGDNPIKLRKEKEKLKDIYKCVCVVGSEQREKYLKNHTPDYEMYVESSR